MNDIVVLVVVVFKVKKKQKISFLSIVQFLRIFIEFNTHDEDEEEGQNEKEKIVSKEICHSCLRGSSIE